MWGRHMKCLAWGPELRGVGASGRLCVIQFWPSNLKHDFLGRGRARRRSHARTACLAGQWGAPGAPLSHHESLQVKPRGFQAGAAQNQRAAAGPASPARAQEVFACGRLPQSTTRGADLDQR